jgi:hypothetical protein
VHGLNETVAATPTEMTRETLITTFCMIWFATYIAGVIYLIFFA